MMPNQNKYSFMGVSSVKQSSIGGGGSSTNTGNIAQGKDQVSKSQPGTSFNSTDPSAIDGRKIYSGNDNKQEMAKSGFSE